MQVLRYKATSLFYSKMNERDMIHKEILIPLINTAITRAEPVTQLVISGGAIWGFSAFGAVYEATEKGLLDLKNITGMYGTSVGAMVTSLLAMKFDMEVYADYLIKRPWQKVWNVDISKIISAYETCGIYSRDFITKFMEPFLNARDLAIDITMLEFYNHTGVELHLYVTELNEFVCVDISHKTHPEWKLVDAIYASCGLPVIFSPHMTEDKCYIDGGFFANYPIDNCVQNIGMMNQHRILGIYLQISNESGKKIKNANLFDYLVDVLQKFVQHRVFSKYIKQDDRSCILYDISLPLGEITLEYCNTLLNSKAERENLVNRGREFMSTYIDSSFIPPTSLQ